MGCEGSLGITVYNMQRHRHGQKGLLVDLLLLLSCKLCPTLCDPMDCSPPGSSVHGISQTRILEWVAIFFYRGFSTPPHPLASFRPQEACFFQRGQLSHRGGDHTETYRQGLCISHPGGFQDSGCIKIQSFTFFLPCNTFSLCIPDPVYW